MVGRSVAVVAKRGETARDVSAYLNRAGACAHVAAASTQIGRDVDAVVFFPDDFGAGDARRVWSELVARPGRVALVVVTGDADAYALVDRRVVVLGRPAWGWMLLDALRTCFSRTAEETS
jgi:hypothetical protein